MPDTGIVIAFPMGEQLVDDYTFLVDDYHSEIHFNTTKDAEQYLIQHPALLNEEYIFLEHAFCHGCGKHHYLTDQELHKTSDRLTCYTCKCGINLYLN